MTSSGDMAMRYHERTKHHYHRYARSAGYLDWANQPDPFRRFAGSPLIELPFRADDDAVPYDDLFVAGAVPAQAMDLASLGSLFELSLALSAWKQYQASRWALRINPSSGNLHPTEGYVVTGPMPGFSGGGGVYHYAAREHALERRASFESRLWQQLVGSHDSAKCVLVGLTSIHWREAWKYGERAYRYCQEDAGHALAAIAISAALLGWHARVLDRVGDDLIAALLGLDRVEDFRGAEAEHPELLLAVGPDLGVLRRVENEFLSERGVRAIAEEAAWHGKANRLSDEHVEWNVINEVAGACWKPKGSVLEIANDQQDEDQEQAGIPQAQSRAVGAAQIIRQRRSAVAFDGETALASADFYRMLGRTLPFRSPPLLALSGPVRIHLGLFVNRVTGLAPGLYCLPRSRESKRALQQAMAATFAWSRPPGCPEDLALYLLEGADVTELAKQVSCGQEIAGDSAFSLGFIAEFARPLGEFGDWIYRRLHWEAGAIGQVLYLEAEAAGLRGTGMGCFFDDAVHEVFGLRDTEFQSLYHFTLGGHVEDTRLTTSPPYSDAVVRSRTKD